RNAARVRQSREVPERSALARPDPLPRVLPRRHRRRPRRQPPDRLDRPHRQAAAAERGMRAVTMHPPWPAYPAQTEPLLLDWARRHPERVRLDSVRPWQYTVYALTVAEPGAGDRPA